MFRLNPLRSLFQLAPLPDQVPPSLRSAGAKPVGMPRFAQLSPPAMRAKLSLFVMLAVPGHFTTRIIVLYTHTSLRSSKLSNMRTYRTGPVTLAVPAHYTIRILILCRQRLATLVNPARYTGIYDLTRYARCSSSLHYSQCRTMYATSRYARLNRPLRGHI